MRAEARKSFELIEPERRWRLGGVLATMVLNALVQTVGVVSIMPFISLVADPAIVTRNPWMAWAYERLGFSGTREFLVAVGFGVIILLAASNAFSAFSRWMSLHFVWSLHHSLSQRLLQKYLREPYSFYLERNTAELSKNLLSEAKGVIDLVVMPCVDLLARGTTIVFLVLLLIIVDPTLAMLAAVTLGGAYAMVYLILRRKQRELGIQRHEAFGERFKIAGEALGGIKDVKVLESENYFLSQFGDASQRFAAASTKHSLISEMPRFALETIAFGGIIATVIYLLETRETLNQVLPIVAVYAVAGYRLMPALQTIFAGLSSIRFYSPMLTSVHDDLFRESPGGSIPSERARVPTSAAASVPLEREIRFRDIGFRYPKMMRPALESVNLVIPAKSTVGFIGATGSGKTTLADLLLGLFEPTNGEILVDDVPLRGENMSAWKRSIGYVSQSIFLADSTVARNIAFGVPPELIDEEAVRRAARAAHLHAFVESLPEGYDAVVGERGIRLSGGERQRIAIARALYRDPSVLVMDEATSALDGATEDAVMQAIRDLSGRKTIVLIAHRLTTVKECDNIFMVEKGRVVAEGTYDSLAAGNAAFRAMARETAAVP